LGDLQVNTVCAEQGLESVLALEPVFLTARRQNNSHFHKCETSPPPPQKKKKEKLRPKEKLVILFYYTIEVVIHWNSV
jgi:hypothetical protein